MRTRWPLPRRKYQTGFLWRRELAVKERRELARHGAYHGTIPSPRANSLFARYGRRLQWLALAQPDDFTVNLDLPVLAKSFGDTSRSGNSRLRHGDLPSAAGLIDGG